MLNINTSLIVNKIILIQYMLSVEKKKKKKKDSEFFEVIRAHSSN